jgi:hypothetical protein
MNRESVSELRVLEQASAVEQSRLDVISLSDRASRRR